MLKRNNQTQMENTVNNRLQVWKMKLVLASALLLIVIVMTSLTMPLLASASHTQVVPSHVQAATSSSLPNGDCNPGPNC
ncbi:MAG TPA: hypothetical protein VFV38_01095 [Ktedonobacteraceae bacterium]|nr:hypothetical protein [Ktedonobacteraceae bacterium]